MLIRSRHLGLSLVLLAGFTCWTSVARQDNQQAMTNLLSENQQRLQQNQQAQQQVDAIAGDTLRLEQDYRQELKVKEGLDIYNLMLQKQLDKQQHQLAQIKHSIANATVIERQIMPLLVRMVDALDGLLKADMPFLLKERQARVDTLKNLLEQPNLTLAEKSRRVFEAYQIEMEYGYTIEAYKAEIDVEGQSLAADILRIGRIALVYQDINGDHVGHWLAAANRWQPLTDSQFRRHINKGLRIAKEEIAPELMTIPFNQSVETLR